MGVNSTAVGSNSTAAFGGAAFGAGAAATGVPPVDAQSSAAFGRNASATNGNDTAIGNNVSTTRANQISVGNTTNQYTFAGITSPASASFQTGPLQVVTSDAGGNLATDGGQIFRSLNSLDSKTKDLGAGIAIASSLATPDRTGNQTWAMAVNWGNYEGFNALSASAIATIAHDFWGGSTVSLGGSIGGSLERNQVAGRVSLQIAGGGGYVPLK